MHLSLAVCVLILVSRAVFILWFWIVGEIYTCPTLVLILPCWCSLTYVMVLLLNSLSRNILAGVWHLVMLCIFVRRLNRARLVARAMLWTHLVRVYRVWPSSGLLLMNPSTSVMLGAHGGYADSRVVRGCTGGCDRLPLCC